MALIPDNFSDLNGVDDEIRITVVDEEHDDLRTELRKSRMWLCQYSTYFSSLFRFRLLCNGESGDKQEVLIKTNIDEFLVYLEYLEGGTEIACANVLPLYKAALYFGGGRSEDNPLLDACQKWLVDCVETEDIYDELVFVNLLNIWIYGFVNDIHWMWSTCQSHITKNFMWASADKYFVNAPLELVLSCIRDPDLVVDSERYLCEVLLMWLSANNATTELLQEVRGCNLPLQFIMANLKELADVEDIPDAVRRLNDASEFDPTTLIRLSKFSERMNLEGCAMITSKKLFQSLLPYSKDGSMEAVLIPDFKSDFKVSWPDEISLGRFTKMVEVDISKCHKLDLVLAINCFRRAFPNLAKIKMRHFWNFDPIEIYPILLKCDLLEELDCSIDKNPLRPGSKNSPLPLSTCVKPVRFPSTSSLLRLKKLTLEGRTDLTGSAKILSRCYGYIHPDVLAKLSINEFVDLHITVQRPQLDQANNHNDNVDVAGGGRGGGVGGGGGGGVTIPLVIYIYKQDLNDFTISLREELRTDIIPMDCESWEELARKILLVWRGRSPANMGFVINHAVTPGNCWPTAVPLYGKRSDQDGYHENLFYNSENWFSMCTRLDCLQVIENEVIENVRQGEGERRQGEGQGEIGNGPIRVHLYQFENRNMTISLKEDFFLCPATELESWDALAGIIQLRFRARYGIASQDVSHINCGICWTGEALFGILERGRYRGVSWENTGWGDVRRLINSVFLIDNRYSPALHN